MGILTDSMFGALMSWVRALVSAIWAVFSSERTTALEFLGKNWMGIAALLVVLGLVVDWLVWLIKWKPYHIWAQRVRRLFGIVSEDVYEEEEAPEELDEEEAARAAYAAFGAEQAAYEADAYAESALPQAREAEDEAWMPLESPVIDEEEAQQVMDAAGQVPDETLGQYPGMRYDSKAAMKEDLGGTRRFGAVHAEGPGAAEVSRRRAEIEAWQLQMQEEARARAQAERAARAEQARLEQEAYEAEQARLAQEAYEAEQARLAQEAYEAEQARLAQEAYQRELEEYERQRAQYERDMAEYDRQKAEYEAAMAQQAVNTEFARENPQEMAHTRRRRAVSYSDMVEGDAVEELPAAPQWTQMTRVSARAEEKETAKKSGKSGLLRSGMAKMAQMMETESEDVTGITSLPPRVDRNAAYRPAKKPKA